MNKWLHRAMLVGFWPFLWLLVPLAHLWADRKEIARDIRNCYALSGPSFRKGGPL